MGVGVGGSVGFGVGGSVGFGDGDSVGIGVGNVLCFVGLSSGTFTSWGSS